MLKRLALIVAMVLLAAVNTRAQPKIAVLQSMRVLPYEMALEGFQSVCPAPIHRVEIHAGNPRAAAREIKALDPALILAIGHDALQAAAMQTKIPVVYLMVLHPAGIQAAKGRITGVRMQISAPQQVRIVVQALPALKSFGLLYNPSQSEAMAQAVYRAATAAGLVVEMRVIDDARKVPSALMEMGSRMDAFWMLPDLTVVTPETVEYLLLFSLQNRVPIITFADKYVELGALMSIGIDATDMGRQAGEMANRILAGAAIEDVGPREARKAVIAINQKIARKLGISIDRDVLDRVQIVP